METKPDLILGTLDDGWISYFYDDPRSTIVIDEEVYRNESQDVVAALIAHEIVRNGLYKQLRPHLLRWWNENVPIPANRHVILDAFHNHFPLGYSKSRQIFGSGLTRFCPMY